MAEIVIESGRRARSDEQKAAREGAILSAARAYIDEVGYDAVTMAELGRRAGVAKGTLYLYFRTKEEVFLKLYSDLLEDFVAGICAFEVQGIEELVTLMTRAARADPLFLPLSARLAAVIEANVSTEALYRSKRAMVAQSQALARHVGAMLSLPEERLPEVMMGIFVVLQGSAQLEAACGQASGTHPEGHPGDVLTNPGSMPPFRPQLGRF